jgi:hypothetical protein
MGSHLVPSQVGQRELATQDLNLPKHFLIGQVRRPESLN